MKNKNLITIILVLIAFLGILFYWYSYRPASIVSRCSFEAEEKAIEHNKAKDGTYQADDRDTAYKWCLQKNGLIE